MIDFNITPLDGVTYPDSFQLTIQVYVGPGVQPTDLDVRHTTTGGRRPALHRRPAEPQDPSVDCILSRTIA